MYLYPITTATNMELYKTKKEIMKKYGMKDQRTFDLKMEKGEILLFRRLTKKCYFVKDEIIKYILGTYLIINEPQNGG